jgi:hypothetical protein
MSGAVWVRLPEVAVRVAVDEAEAVPRGAISVSVAAVPGVSVTGDGCTVTPAGRPVIDTCTVEENPFCAVASREAVAGVPLAVNVTAAGMTLSEKSAGAAAACTVSEAWVLAVCPPTVVVSVTVEVVGVAEEPAVSVRGRATPGVSDSVDGEMVTPAGSPETETVTGALPAGAASNREAC